MKSGYNLRLLAFFSIAFSLAAITGPTSAGLHLPNVQLAHANLQPCPTHGLGNVCSEFWYPAGPEMNTLNAIPFADASAEYTNLQSPSPSIDFTDTPCPPAVCQTLASSPNFLVTAPIAQTAYYEIDFHLGNVFWNCNFNFGNSACGIEIRQAIAHMFDKNSFCATSVIAGICTPIDNPVPTSSGGGLPSPNPCTYDSRFPQSGTNCVVGSPGGTAYHLATSTGANGSPWLYAPGSRDLNAADTHLVAAGVATGFNTTTSILTGSVRTNTPTFFIRTDDPARLQLGQSLAEQICYVFTGSYTQPCLPFLNIVLGPITVFPGLQTCVGCVTQNFWMYTAGFTGVTFFDSSLYHTYNSRFVSGNPNIQPPNGPCSPQAVPTSNAANYVYLCSPNYDSLSNQMEFAPCLVAPGDPSPGSPNNGPGADCPNASQLSAISAGIQTEAIFGAGAFTIPVFEQTSQYGYLHGWSRVVNNPGLGLPNYFTWLNAYNPVPAMAGTIRQGFSQTTRSVNPYIGSTVQDGYIIGSVYDTLSVLNPLSSSQLVNWMTYSVRQLDNATVRAQSGYEPPSGTLATFRFTLRNDVFFHDGRPVSAYDVAFSYLSMVGSGAFFGGGASSMSGVTVLSPRTFDIGVKTLGPFTLANIAGIYILPGRYWTGAGTPAYDAAVAACTGSNSCAKAQYSLSGQTVNCPTGIHPGCASFSASNMQIDPSKITATYDPIANNTFVGSGPWQCGTVTGSGSGTCSSNAQLCPVCGTSYILTRFGSGLAPASSASGIYFRSSGDLALYIWSQENDISPILPLSFAASCFGQPVNLNGPCAHWQQGIGASSTGVVGINQVSIVYLRFNLNWISPYELFPIPPTGMTQFPPVLYEGSVTLNPGSVAGCPNGYDC